MRRSCGVKHSEFFIGLEFFVAGGRRRCTDVGSRVIVAISLEPRELVRVWFDADGQRCEERFMSDDPRDLRGPPYMIIETVLDECDLPGCSLTPIEP